MKRLIATSLLAAAATTTAFAAATPHNERDEDLRVSPEMSQKADINMVISFRLAHAANPAMKAGDKITWQSPFSGKAAMKLREVDPKAMRYDDSAVDKAKLTKDINAMSEDELIAAGFVKRTATCYHFNLEEKDIAPAAEIARSRAAIKRGNYVSFNRSHSQSYCIEQLPIPAMTREFLKAQQVPEATIKAYQARFPEGSQLPNRVVMGGSTATGKTPRETAKP